MINKVYDFICALIVSGV